MWHRVGLARNDVAAHVPSSRSLSTLKMEATRSSEISDIRRATWRHILEDSIFPNRLYKNLKSYVSYVPLIKRERDH
jgi:hypothetical protein